MDEVLVTLHILSAAAWIGASLFLGFAGPRFRDIGGPAVVGWITVVLGAIPRYLAPAAVLTALTGAILVVVQDEWSWGDPFVWIGLSVFVIVLLMGLTWNGPNLRRALAAIEAKDMPAVGQAMKKVSMAGLLIVLLLFFAEFAMVSRLGV